VIHPQSIIHSMVEFVDGSIKAQMGIPDMRLPIQFALTYPERRSCIANSNMLFSGMQLTFSDPDEKQFPCLKLAYQAIDEGGTAPAVLNAANEVAVQSFLDGKIKFLAIPALVNAVLQEQESGGVLEIEDCLDADRQARELTKTKVARYE
jgi:1-deoxy-D-xylulose-5-phosphate reductoisomerase